MKKRVTVPVPAREDVDVKLSADPPIVIPDAIYAGGDLLLLSTSVLFYKLLIEQFRKYVCVNYFYSK